MPTAQTSIVRDPDATGSPESQADALRAQLRTMWGAVAPGWEEYAEFIDSRGAELTEAMLQAAELKPGERVVELAAGPGGLGLEAAKALGSRSEVVVSDVATEMTAIAARRAEELGLSNVTARDLDLEAIDEPDSSFDAVLCREGLMLVVDPVRAAREIRRVLRPGGRAVVAVWAERERNPWLGRVFDAVSAELGTQLPPPGVPQPFSLGDSGSLEAVMADAGFGRVRIAEVEVPYSGSSADEWWSRTTALAGPLRGVVAALPEPKRAALAARAREAVAEFETPDGLDIPGVSRLAIANR